MNRWREYVEHSRDLLGQAQVAANTPRETLDYLYKAIVAVTQAICELEKPDDKPIE